jgi:hypothetical protein
VVLRGCNRPMSLDDLLNTVSDHFGPIDWLEFSQPMNAIRAALQRMVNKRELELKAGKDGRHVWRWIGKSND